MRVCCKIISGMMYTSTDVELSKDYWFCRATFVLTWTKL
uniref:Uncharacterized protein n=1 Tax=Zea mays TaxID=4577 RepID=C4J0Z4_MAIZE|nr:unknown [Zea mays]